MAMKDKMRKAGKPVTGSSIQDKFRKQKQDLMKRHQEQVDNKDQGSEFPTIFDKTKIPKGIEFWKPGKGEHVIDIIPFFTGSQNPRVPEGQLAYVVDLWVHINVGPLRTPYPCLTKNFKQPDPICDYIAKNRLSKDEWKTVASKRRTAYLVWVHDDDKEEAKGLQIWEVAHFYFEEHIDEIAKSPKGGGAVAFSDFESGKSIAFTIKVTGKYQDGQGVERDSIGYVGHRFVDRDVKTIPNHILEQTFPLDEAINMHPDYDEMSEAFSGAKAKAKERSRYREESEEVERCEVCDEIPEECTCSGPVEDEDDIPFDKGKASRKARPEPEPEEPEDDNAEEDESEEDESEEEFTDEDEPEEEGESEEEVTECPHDPDSFGEVDEHPECEADGGCPLWDACSDEAQKRKKAEREKSKAKSKVEDKKPTASSKVRKFGKK